MQPEIYVDAMFGKLGNFLRILGFDTKIADPNLSDKEIFQQVISSNRMLITRDYEFYQSSMNLESNNC